MPRLRDDPIAPSLAPGLGEEEMLKDIGPPDFDRGAGGEPIITMPDGKSERYARTSSLGDTLDEKSALNNWLVSKAMEGMGRNPEIVAKVIAVTPYDDHKPAWTKLREEAIQAGRGAYRADVGTAVHAMSHRWETEPTFDPGEPYRSALEAYTVVKDSLGLVSQMFECHIVNDVIRVAGTADRLFQLTRPLLCPDGTILPAGTLIIGDLKTGDSLEYAIPGYTIQLAGYAGGVLYDVEAQVRMPTPSICQRWAIIMHLDVENAHCDFLWVDLEVGRYGAHLANEVREWRRAWRRVNGYKAGVQEIQVAPEAPEPEGEYEITELPEKPKRAPRAKKAAAPAPTPEPQPQPEVEVLGIESVELELWRDYCRNRLGEIRLNVEAKEWMLVRWPEGLLAPKALTTVDEARALSKFLDRVEAEFGMQFTHIPPVEAVVGKRQLR